jgi:hypothetical protein
MWPLRLHVVQKRPLMAFDSSKVTPATVRANMVTERDACWVVAGIIIGEFNHWPNVERDAILIVACAKVIEHALCRLAPNVDTAQQGLQELHADMVDNINTILQKNKNNDLN